MILDDTDNTALNILEDLLFKIIEHDVWELGIFGGQKITIYIQGADPLYLKVPLGIELILFEIIKINNKNSKPTTILNNVIDKLTQIKNYHGHGLFNKRANSTQKFYDDTDTWLKEGITALELK